MLSTSLLPTVPGLPSVPARTPGDDSRLPGGQKPATPPAVMEYLLSHLIALPFADFARLLARLLEEMGYEDVRLMGATHGRGRNHHGGLDLQASLAGGLSRSRIIAQVKQYKEPVPRAYVDELRGTMLRLGAQQAMLFTTSAFALATIEAAQAAQHTAPVRLVDGAQLVELLLTYGLVGAQEPQPMEAVARGGTPQKPVPSKPAPSNGAGRPLLPDLRRSLPEPARPEGTALHVAVQVTLLPPTGSAGAAPIPLPQRPAATSQRRRP